MKIVHKMQTEKSLPSRTTGISGYNRPTSVKISSTDGAVVFDNLVKSPITTQLGLVSQGIKV